jgi:putative ABC transport system permease protein
MMPKDNEGRVRGENLYRLLLHVYPRRFRQRYVADMVAFYRERVRGADRSELTRFVGIWLQLVPDLVASALAERFVWLHRETDRAPRVVREYAIHREATMSILRQDATYALRAMMRRPAFTAVILGTLALGIGANAAIFTLVNAVLLRPLPFAHSERIVEFEQGDGYWTVSEPEFVDYQRGVTALAKLAAYNSNNVTIAIPGTDPIRSVATRALRDFFETLGVKTEVGRTFATDEFSPSSRARVAVISHRMWVQQFAADPRIVGKSVTVGITPFTIVGVMPGNFTFPDRETEFWTPWRLNPDSLWTRNNHYLRMIGQLGTGSTIAQARAQVRTLNQRWMKDFPETYAPDHPITGQLTPIRDFLLGPTRPYFVALLGAVAFILSIACVNVANLLLVRGEARRKEFAIRTALGASRSRMMRQMFTESMLFALFGAALGVVVAWLGLRAMIALAPDNVPRLGEVGVDYRVVLFTVAITIATGLLFGIAPAMRGTRGESADTLRDGGKTSGHAASAVARRALVVAEVALAVVMLTGAGLLIRSLIKLQEINLGFDPSHVLTMQVTLPPRKYNDTTADAYFQQLLARASRLPGAQSAAAVSYLPISGSDNGWSIMIDGRVVKTIAESPSARPENVTADYFRVMSIRLVRGRVFTEQDRMGAPPVAIISEGMARKLWPGVDPIGHTLKMFDDKAPWVTIVGIVADVRARGFQKDIPETMYFPYAQSGQSSYVMPLSMTAIVRAKGNPAGLIAPLRNLVHELDATVPVSQAATMDQIVGGSISDRRFATTLLAGFAALALALAGIGIYGVISYGVSQRTYEIGVRMAMGASPASIMRLVMREGGRMTVVGLLFGLIGAVAIDRLLRTMLVGVSATDIPTLLGVSGVLAAVAAGACLLPARRATGVSPTEALRNN